MGGWVGGWLGMGEWVSGGGGAWVGEFWGPFPPPTSDVFTLLPKRQILLTVARSEPLDSPLSSQ